MEIDCLTELGIGYNELTNKENVGVLASVPMELFLLSSLLTLLMLLSKFKLRYENTRHTLLTVVVEDQDSKLKSSESFKFCNRDNFWLSGHVMPAYRSL